MAEKPVVYTAEKVDALVSEVQGIKGDPGEKGDPGPEGPAGPRGKSASILPRGLVVGSAYAAPDTGKLIKQARELGVNSIRVCNVFDDRADRTVLRASADDPKWVEVRQKADAATDAGMTWELDLSYVRNILRTALQSNLLPHDPEYFSEWDQAVDSAMKGIKDAKVPPVLIAIAGEPDGDVPVEVLKAHYEHVRDRLRAGGYEGAITGGGAFHVDQIDFRKIWPIEGMVPSIHVYGDTELRVLPLLAAAAAPYGGLLIEETGFESNKKGDAEGAAWFDKVREVVEPIKGLISGLGLWNLGQFDGGFDLSEEKTPLSVAAWKRLCALLDPSGREPAPAPERRVLRMSELGAKADGQTDDSAALRKGFQLLTKSGGTIEFEPGRIYKMTGWVQGIGKGITLEGNGATIDRAGSGGILFASQATDNRHIPDGGEDFTVRNLRVKGTFSGEKTNVVIASLHHARNITFEGCIFDKCHGDGHTFDVVATDGFTLRNCTWLGRHVTGDGTLRENIQIGASLQGTLSHEQAKGYDGVACSNVLIENCRFLPDSPLGVGPNIVGSHDKLEHGTHRNVVVRGCTVVNPYANGGKNGGSVIELHSVMGLVVEGNSFVCKKPTDARIVEVTGRQTGIKADRDLNVKPDWNHDDPITPLPVEDVSVVNNVIQGFALSRGNSLVRMSGSVPPMVVNGVFAGNIIKWGEGNQGTEADMNCIGALEDTNLVFYL